MQPTLCSRCHKNVAVIFITRIENGESHKEGLCLRCARELLARETLDESDIRQLTQGLVRN